MRLSPKNLFLISLQLFIFCSVLLVSEIGAQTAELPIIKAEDLKDGKTFTLKDVGWKYKVGDDPNFATKDFNDADWTAASDTAVKEELLDSADWKGRVWYRARFRVEEGLIGRELILMLRQLGASEIYLNGNLLTKFGEITENSVKEYNPNQLPVFFKFGETSENILAVRFASQTFSDLNDFSARWLKFGKVFPLFDLSLRETKNQNESVANYAASVSMRPGFLVTGILLSLGLLHFLLYLFYRVERANLFYAIYVISFGLSVIFSNYATFGNLNIEGHLYSGIVRTLLGATVFIALMAFIQVAFKYRIHKIFWFLVILWGFNLLLFIALLNRYPQTRYIQTALFGLSIAFCIIYLVKALRDKRSGAWILMIGVQVYAFATIYSLLRFLGIINGFQILNVIAEFLSILPIPIAVSVFLARNFSRTNRDLTAQLAQVEELSAHKIEQEKRNAELHAENERRMKELEEARKLQLSMLPKNLPQIPNVEIAAYMKPATEVGGDYYDFHVGTDGTLTAAIGDATGHGLKAGTVVTATKSLFNNLADSPDIPDTLNQMSRSLKRMNLRGLFMAMTLLKLKENRLSIASAGMPSALIYRAINKRVDEISIRAVPLGSIAKFGYRQEEINLADGDCIVIMSDGFPEMFNPENEILGFDKAAEILRLNASRKPSEIINEFLHTSEKWAEGRTQEDDITFVVIKVGKNSENGN